MATVAMQYRIVRDDMNVGYDLNVWDEGLHNEEDSRWKISLHHLEELEDGSLQTGDHIEDVSFYFTPDEARQLTLGLDPELGGVYGADTDFFIDPAGFLDVYKDVMPDRVREFVSQYL